MRIALALFLSAFLVGCAGKVAYTRPMAAMNGASNVKTIDKPREEVWNKGVPELGKRFFVINNLDKSSGLINVSYTGDPEKYVDCGRITSYVKNGRGERTYDFPGAQAQQSYEVMENLKLGFIDRKMTLEGRVNLVFEEISPTQTRVTANTRYVVQRHITVRLADNNFPQTVNDSISFNSGGSASYPSRSATVGATECASTGALEAEILSGIK